MTTYQHRTGIMKIKLNAKTRNLTQTRFKGTLKRLETRKAPNLQSLWDAIIVFNLCEKRIKAVLKTNCT